MSRQHERLIIERGCGERLTSDSSAMRQRRTDSVRIDPVVHDCEAADRYGTRRQNPEQLLGSRSQNINAYLLWWVND